MRVLAWCGIAAPVIRLSLILWLGSLQPDYSQTRDFISELGARGAPYAAMMNYAGTVLVGVLLALFAIALYRTHRPSLLAAGGAGLLALSGFAFVVVGLFPCDPGCSLADPSSTMRIHLLAGTVATALQALAVLFFGMRVFSRHADRLHAALSLALGLVALGALVILHATAFQITSPGLVQKTFQVSTDAWVFLSAVWIPTHRPKAA